MCGTETDSDNQFQHLTRYCAFFSSSSSLHWRRCSKKFSAFGHEYNEKAFMAQYLFCCRSCTWKISRGYIILIVSKSPENTKTNNKLILLTSIACVAIARYLIPLCLRAPLLYNTPVFVESIQHTLTYCSKKCVLIHRLTSCLSRIC